MEYVTKAARAVPEREARAFCVIAPRAIHEWGLMEYVTKTARAVPW